MSSHPGTSANVSLTSDLLSTSMKMANFEKAEGFVGADSLTECPDNTEAATNASLQEDQEEVLKTETTPTTTTSSPTRDKELDSASQTEGDPGLLSMPCLMKELRRDSPESQPASTGSDKPASRNVYESDSSNPCMLSPSSSGHLADSDTLSSGEDSADSRVPNQGEGSMETGGGPGQPERGKHAQCWSGGGSLGAHAQRVRCPATRWRPKRTAASTRRPQWAGAQRSRPMASW